MKTLTMTISNKLFKRTLYTPHYRYYPGVEEVIREVIQKLVLEHNAEEWTPSETTTIEVDSNLAYGRTEIFRLPTPED
jgi:hypothetical protein